MEDITYHCVQMRGLVPFGALWSKSWTDARLTDTIA
jgi:hypothetical protein